MIFGCPINFLKLIRQNFKILPSVLLLIIFLNIFLIKSVSASEVFSAVGERGAANANTGTSLTIPLTNPTLIEVGNHLTLRVIISATRTISISDPRSNVWQQDVYSAVGTGSSRTAVLSVKVTNAYQAGDSITVNLSGTGTVAMAGVIDEWGGLLDTGWFDLSSSAGLDSSSPTSNTFDSGLTSSSTQNKNLILGVIGLAASSSTVTPETLSPVWTVLGSQSSTGTARTVYGHYRQINTGGTFAYIGTFNSTRTHVAIVAVYKLKASSTPPTAPSSLSATASHSNRVALTWRDNSNTEDTFSVYRAPDVSGSPGIYTALTTSLSADTTSYKDYTTSASTKYWYKVTAVNTAGGSDSNVVSATTPSGAGEGVNALPVDIGIWINKTELDLLPISGGDSRVAWWTRMKAAADTTWPAIDFYNDGQHNLYTLAGALTFARLKPADGSADTYADSMRTKVRNAISSLISSPVDTSYENTRPARFLLSYVVSADLIRLKDFDPELNDSFRDWLNSVIYADFNTGGGASSLYKQTYVRSTNTSNMSRASVAAAFRYLGNTSELDNVAFWTAAFMGDSTSIATQNASIYLQNWQINTYNVDPWFTSDYSDSFGSHYWQPTPGDTTTYYGILPVGSFKNDRNGNPVNLDGVVPGDWGRNGPFVTQDSPFTGLPHDPPYATTNYNWTTTRGLSAAVLVLERAGYPARTWGNNALKRLMNANLRFYQNYASRDWAWSDDSIAEWVPALINYIYSDNFSHNYTRTSSNGISGQGENMGWTAWTHEGRTLAENNLDHFDISVSNHNVNEAFNITVTAKDSSNNTLTDFISTAQVTSTGTLSAGSGTTAAFTGGVLTHLVTFSNSGSFTIAVSHSATNKTSTSNSFTISAIVPTPSPSPSATPQITPTPTTSDDSDDESSECTKDEPGDDAPNLYSADAKSKTSINLYFTDAEKPFNKYDIEYGGSSKSYNVKIGEIDKDKIKNNKYTINNLREDTTYYFRVRGRNDCAKGPWSNEIFVKTKSNSSPKTPEIVSSTLVSSNSTTESPVPSPTIKPSVPTFVSRITPAITNKPAVTNIPTPKVIETNVVESEGYDLEIIVKDTQNKPVANATVTIHSDPKTSKTNNEGVAKFTNVEGGDHKVYIAYNNSTAEQSLYIGGDQKQLELTVKLKSDNQIFTPISIGIIGGLVLIIFIILFLVLKKKLFNNN